MRAPDLEATNLCWRQARDGGRSAGAPSNPVYIGEVRHNIRSTRANTGT
jgi:hypothetical protein